MDLTHLFNTLILLLLMSTKVFLQPNSPMLMGYAGAPINGRLKNPVQGRSSQQKYYPNTMQNGPMLVPNLIPLPPSRKAESSPPIKQTPAEDRFIIKKALILKYFKSFYLNPLFFGTGFPPGGFRGGSGLPGFGTAQPGPMQMPMQMPMPTAKPEEPKTEPPTTTTPAPTTTAKPDDKYKYKYKYRQEEEEEECDDRYYECEEDDHKYYYKK